jgi:hypothetical protein
MMQMCEERVDELEKGLQETRASIVKPVEDKENAPSKSSEKESPCQVCKEMKLEFEQLLQEKEGVYRDQERARLRIEKKSSSSILQEQCDPPSSCSARLLPVHSRLPSLLLDSARV